MRPSWLDRIPLFFRAFVAPLPVRTMVGRGPIGAWLLLAAIGAAATCCAIGRPLTAVLLAASIILVPPGLLGIFVLADTPRAPSFLGSRTGRAIVSWMLLAGLWLLMVGVLRLNR